MSRFESRTTDGDDARDCLAALRARGVEIRNEPREVTDMRLQGGLAMRWTLLPDPDDNLIELMEYRKET